MNVNATMSVKDAMKMFTDIMQSLRANDRHVFLTLIADEWKPEQMRIESALWKRTDDCNCCNGSNLQEDQLRYIKTIVEDIRERVPFDGILPSESIIPPTRGENSDCDSKSTKHVDAFLYDNKEYDELIEEGRLTNLYCSSCGSENIKEYNMISHSMSVSALLYIFYSVLPCLKGKTLLDIGSRLGAVLYMAHVFTPAEKIIGVEMNRELCELQYNLIEKYQMNDRIEIVNKRIEECSEIVGKSDVIIINNPFEFYVSESVHIEIWKFLKSHTRRGTILVTRPHIETTLKDLETGILINEWVKPCELEKSKRETQVFGSLILDPEDNSDIQFYEVL